MAKYLRPTEATEASATLRRAMEKRTKKELVELLMTIADDEAIRRRIAGEVELDAPPDELIAATRRAIADATAFDEKYINYNFDYDSDAYDEVQRNLARLVELGELQHAMELSLNLMDRGTHQVEMSDEGLMSGTIEECLRPVIVAVETADLPAKDRIAWCKRMQKLDRVGFVCDQELQTLQKRLEGLPS